MKQSVGKPREETLAGYPVRRMPPLSPALRASLGHPNPPARGQLMVASMGRIGMAPGESDVWHSHADLFELCVQSEGTVLEHFGGVPFEMRAGDVVLFPAGQLHGCTNRQGTRTYQYVIHFYVSHVPLVEGNPRFRATPGRPLCRLIPGEMLWFEQLFNQLWWEETTRHAEFEAMEDLLLKQIFLGLGRVQVGRGGDLAIRETPSADVVRFISYVSEALAQRNPVYIASERLGSNYDSFRHRFKRETGLSPKRFVMQLRLQQAKHLLLTTRLSIKEIAAWVGFGDAHHFTRIFNKETGFSPMDWRRHPRLRTYPSDGSNCNYGEQL